MLKQLLNLLKQNADEKQAEKMSAYMQNKFKFYGIPKPILKEFTKPFLKETSKENLDWDLVKSLWEVDFREAQYVALMYLDKHKNSLCQKT